LIIHQSLSYSRIFQHIIEPEVSLPYSQEPSTGSCPEIYQSSPYHSILFKIHFNIILLPTSRTPWWYLSFWLSHQKHLCIHLLPHACYIPCPPHFLELIILIVLGEWKLWSSFLCSFLQLCIPVQYVIYKNKKRLQWKHETNNK
jgi:hypothetical protein